MEGPDLISTESTWLLNLTPPIAVASAAAEHSSDSFFRGFPGKNSPYTTTRAILLALVLGSIIIGTVIGNILVCVAVFLVKKLRKPCNYLLVSLAVSDICVALLVMPMAMLFEIKGSWSFGPTMCEIWVSFDVLSCTASILNLCMISVDRYYAISKPLDYGVKRTTRRMIIYVAFVWLGAACISLPPLLVLGNEYTETEDGLSHCSVCQNFGYQIYATLGSFYIPLFVMILVYYKIFCAARKIVLEEKRAQSHLEAYCHLDIEQQLPAPILHPKANSDGQTNRVTSPTEHHRSSSASTTCSVHAVKCFAGGPRKSNESQCPMLQPCLEKQPILVSATTVTTPLTGSSVPRQPANSRQRKHANSTSSEVNSPHKQKRLRLQLAKERKASTTLGIIMSAFTICWLPFFVLTMIRICLSDPSLIPASLSSMFLWLGYCNSLLNPIIYATLNRDFRKPFREILYFRCGNLQHMMREEFYQSQYGDPVNNYVVRSTNETVTTGATSAATAAAVSAAAAAAANATRIDPHEIDVVDLTSANPPSESFL
ncbi:5-hydroxytryptamine receptor 1 [Nasonia vitripennis]|uniref:G-protein coupled receptors family 1 profile domain-containing protein n=1 Tax=Nasonia vitripennis TaxID=7425 RepID=A0A7M7GG45_NASVI|nr:5-hydroxytryptamine receptor 1 [Nasonia vitripennis]XP_031776620.1 5-hydroxytryptamine receptor 1 [Nasonia vitripennis]